MRASRLWAACAVLAILCQPAVAHDIYNGLHDGFDDHNEQTFRRDVGRLCCDGGPTGDCEAVESGYRVLPNGNYRIWSERYHLPVDIAPSRVGWTGVAGSDAEVHWCGNPRAKMPYPQNFPVTEEDPDILVHTYCIFIVPGGM
jgi:hypothetical protein